MFKLLQTGGDEEAKWSNKVRPDVDSHLILSHGFPIFDAKTAKDERGQRNILSILVLPWPLCAFASNFLQLFSLTFGTVVESSSADAVFDDGGATVVAGTAVSIKHPEAIVAITLPLFFQLLG